MNDGISVKNENYEDCEKMVSFVGKEKL